MRDNRTIAENYDSINELPLCYSTLTGIKIVIPDMV